MCCFVSFFFFLFCLFLRKRLAQTANKLPRYWDHNCEWKSYYLRPGKVKVNILIKHFSTTGEKLANELPNTNLTQSNVHVSTVAPRVMK